MFVQDRTSFHTGILLESWERFQQKGENSMCLIRYFVAIMIVLAVAIGAFTPRHARAASLVEITNFGTNPSNLRMFVYVPANVAANPPILVAVHYCHGDGPAFFAGSQFDELSEQYGYIVIYPSVTQASDGCFDVSSSAALTRGGGSDPVGIMSMVTYVQQNYNGDPNRVYVTGVSSGAMMTNVLLGDYPDVFKAGVAFAGVPFGCFAVNPDSLRWSSACATGTVTRTAQEWGDIVRGAYPGYSGPRPRFQIWHGTADEVLSYVNFGEEIKQWTNVHGISQTPTTTDSPQSGWTRTRYNSSAGVMLEAISMQGVPHNLPVNAAEALRFFGLDGSVTLTPSITPGGPTLTPSRTPTKTLTPTITNTPAPGLQIKMQSANVDTNSQSSVNLQISNTGATTLNNVTWRWYFNTENGNAASSYVLEKYYDQSGVATVSGPTLACGNTYYFTVSYGTTNIPMGTTWAYNTAFHLSSFASTYDSSNDWWHTGYAVGALPAAFTINTYLSGYQGSTRIWGNEPTCSGGTPTNTPAVPTITSTRTLTPVITLTRTSTASITPTRTLTSAITNTPTRTATRTNTPAVTPTRTVGASPTRTLTPPAAVTATRTPTAAPATATPTSGAGACSPVTSTIAAPFTFDGAGTFCWQASTLVNYINSWNATSVSVNGTNYTNLYATVSSLPAKIGGYWYISYNSTVGWGHFEAK
jgi:poly(hydroxyalkanoate) depolymerase family esterase